MLKIKLARFGKRNQPHYRFVVIEAREKRDGQYTANLGFYAPTATPKTLQIDLEAYKGWLKKGAQPTDTVSSLVKRFESGTPFPEKTKKLSKKAKAKQAQAAEAAAQEKAAAEPAQPVAAEAPTAPEAAPAETATESK